MIEQVIRKVRTSSIRRVAPYVIAVVLIVFSVFSFLLIQWWIMISPRGFKKTENIEITDYEFSQTLNITVQNRGTTMPTIIEAKVNGTTVDIADVTVDFPSSGSTQTLTIFYDWIPKTTYDISLVTAKGKEFNCTVVTP